ncbi:MAG: sulfite exporter TauE/SafE family protein [Actinobacteria bacterium]|nr:sulfite exporter TauE/SafE family protein [Actinomycetota bacterium]
MDLTPGFELAILVGAVGAGVLGALMGLGGGVLIIPMLTALGVDIRHAIAASIVAVIATSCGAASSYVRDGLANIRIGIFLCVATTTGALFGAALNGVLPVRALFLIFAVVLAWSGIVMYKKRGRSATTAEPSGAVETQGAAGGRLRLAGRFYDPAIGRDRRYVPRRPALGFGLMLGAGTVSGLLGIGSGALKVPAMDVAMDLPIKVSTATSNFMIGITGLASALIYLERGQVLVSLVAPIALGVVGGAAVGTRLLPKLSADTIRSWFVVVLAAVVVQMLYRGVTG